MTGPKQSYPTTAWVFIHGVVEIWLTGPRALFLDKYAAFKRRPKSLAVVVFNI